jgi:hypothetical protein
MIAKDLDENLTDAEIEELIVGAKKRSEMLKLGVVRSDENSKQAKDFDHDNFVSKEEFIKILSGDINDDKIKIPKKQT